MGWLSVLRQCVRKLGKDCEMKDMRPFTVKIFAWDRLWILAGFLIFPILCFSTFTVLYGVFLFLLWSQLVPCFGKCKDLFVSMVGKNSSCIVVFVKQDMVTKDLLPHFTVLLSLSHVLADTWSLVWCFLKFLKSNHLSLSLSISPFIHLSWTFLNREGICISHHQRLCKKGINSPNYRP